MARRPGDPSWTPCTAAKACRARSAEPESARVSCMAASWLGDAAATASLVFCPFQPWGKVIWKRSAGWTKRVPWKKPWRGSAP